MSKATNERALDGAAFDTSQQDKESCLPRPVVACYVPEFLKRDMNHIYRQVVGLTRFHPVVITRKREEEERFPFDPSQIRHLPKSRLRFFRRLLHGQLLRAPIPLSSRETAALRKALEETKASLLHVYFGHVAARLLPFLREQRLPTIVSFHGADGSSGLENPRYRGALEEVFQHVTLVLGRSEALLASLEKIGCPPQKLRLQRTGIPLEKWPESARQAPSDGSWRFAQICRLVPKKGLETTLRTFASILRNYPEAQLSLAGDGPESGHVRQLITELGLGHSVTLSGFLDEDGVKRLLADCHFFFHPSRTDADGNQEGIPNAMLEAMAMGIPPLATLHGGIPEAVENKVSGILVAEDDSTKLAHLTLELMAAPPECYASMSTATRQAVSSGFSRQAQIASLEEAYQIAIDSLS